MIVYPNAKINIGLNIVERRPDGYHNLETVFYPVNITDALEVKTSDASSRLSLEGIPVEGSVDDNLVMRAYMLLAADFDLPAVDVNLVKNIPTGAGLGGGSSDAAFMLKSLNQLFSLGLSAQTLEDYAVRLGADCAFFVHDKPVFATGIGNIFHDIQLDLSSECIVLVKPNVFVSTRDAYAMVKPLRPSVPLPQLLTLPIEQWEGRVVNDFERSVFPKFPEIARVKQRLYDLGAQYASMSGSGSSVFGIFQHPIPDLADHFPGMFTAQM